MTMRGFLRRLPQVSALTLCVACGGVSGGDRALPAAGSAEEQAELRTLEAEWQVSSNQERGALRPRLERYVHTFVAAPSAARARLMLARIALSEGRLGAVEGLLQPVLNAGPGRVQDEAMVILAALRSRQNQPESALRLLEPLSGKLLTEDAQHEFSVELAKAALKSRRWRLAVDTMVTWLAEATERRDEAREWVLRALVTVPPAVLVRLLADWSATAGRAAQRPARQWVQRALLEHLSRVALSQRQPQLARDLLAHAPAWLRISAAGAELSALASLALDEARVSGRLVGIVLGGADAASKQRSVALAAGLMHGVRSQATADSGFRVLAEEGRGGVQGAMAALSGQGATIVIAGTDPTSALEALVFAEARKLPVVVLETPPELKVEALHFGFDFGVSRAAETGALLDALARAGFEEANLVGGIELPCEKVEASPLGQGLPLAKWREDSVTGVGVLGGAHCASRVAREIGGGKPSFYLALGLEAAAGPLPAVAGLAGISFLRAGAYPAAQFAPESDRFIEAKTERIEVPSGWYERLGLDLALLLDAALAGLPESVTSDPEEVRGLHVRARDALLSAEAALVTTERRGFAGSHRIVRQLRSERVAGVGQ